jgi:hypothetical protein
VLKIAPTNKTIEQGKSHERAAKLAAQAEKEAAAAMLKGMAINPRLKIAEGRSEERAAKLAADLK